MVGTKVSFRAGFAFAVLLLASCLVSKTSDSLGGNWRVESRSASLGAERNFQRLLFRKHPSVLVESDVRDVQYCGDDCALYATVRTETGPIQQYRAACGDRQPVLFGPEGPSIWRIKDCALQNIEYLRDGETSGSVETYREVFSRDEIKRKARAQRKATLKRKLLQLEYVDLPPLTKNSGSSK
jgi:hypothetical protein